MKEPLSILVLNPLLRYTLPSYLIKKDLRGERIPAGVPPRTSIFENKRLTGLCPHQERKQSVQLKLFEQQNRQKSTKFVDGLEIDLLKPNELGGKIYPPGV
jgi:hypothetical protein